ncbi:MAG: UvrD-helicase domain-containing protein [Spirochaetes bacterium]|nr:UvrD-helicase domain-containing protein [Spirochaetota bacterium]
MDIYGSLNETQRKAVTHVQGPLLILAGAGSGKTRVITHRIAYLMFREYARPHNIFAVTFTNKAAEEMQNRVSSMIGPSGKSVFIKTFHSASVFILRLYGERIGIPRNFSIYDQSDQESVVKEILLRMKLDPKKIRPSMIVSKISEIKDRAELLQGANIDSMLPKYYNFNFTEIYEEYHRTLKSHNALDFNDLLVRTVELLQSSPETLDVLQSRWSHFMVDEYQDTNYSQYCITKLLASRSRNICVVGDDDQSIYSWRGADIRNILNFENDYPEAMVVTLGKNYRSTKPILDVATSVISHNSMRKQKELSTEREDGEPAVWIQANNEYGEAEFVINTIKTLKYRERFSNRDFTIFYRTNAQSRIFEDLLRRENIPYRVIGGLRFYDRKEIKDILAYLKFLSNPRDLVSLLRIINVPARGIGRSTVDRIRQIAGDESLSEWDVIRDTRITGKAGKSMAEFAEIIASLQALNTGVPGELPLSKFIDRVLSLTGYMKSLEDEDTFESSARIDNLNEFINGVYAFEMAVPGCTLDQFLQEISLYTTQEDPDENPDEAKNSVTLMTIHNAKGLEFPVVFITGMEEEIFPHRLCTDTDEGIEEERRLCYVGITRARERVYLTSAELRRSYTGVFHRDPSRFLLEIPDDLIMRDYYTSDAYMNPSPRFAQGYRAPQPARRDEEDEIEENGGGNGSTFRVSETVVHPKYGQGRIVRIEGSGDNCKLTILFGASKKVFLEKYTPLERI